VLAGDPTDPKNVARALNVVLGSDLIREKLAVNGQKRAVDKCVETRSGAGCRWLY
jgi:hypothetical protein